ncbi:hypothetical protein ACS0TY_008301 [Phlomoides rotata]
MTAKLAGAANLPFLLLHLPQIVLNTRNLLERNTSALLAIPWLGVLTGLLENLCLASYFIKKRKTEATVVQTLGVISTYVVMLQLAMVKAMPLPQFIVTSVVVASGYVVNFNSLCPKYYLDWDKCFCYCCDCCSYGKMAFSDAGALFSLCCNFTLCLLKRLMNFTRILRDRALYKVTTDFVEAATNGAIGVISRCIPPINPTEPIQSASICE